MTLPSSSDFHPLAFKFLKRRYEHVLVYLYEAILSHY